MEKLISIYLMKLIKLGLDTNKEVIKNLKHTGKIGHIKVIPKKIRDSFKTAIEIKSSAHLEIQATIQEVVDDAISKTINLPKYTTLCEVEDIYKTAYFKNIKGITVFRTGSNILIQPKKVSTNQKLINK